MFLLDPFAFEVHFFFFYLIVLCSQTAAKASSICHVLYITLGITCKRKRSTHFRLSFVVFLFFLQISTILRQIMILDSRLYIYFAIAVSGC